MNDDDDDLLDTYPEGNYVVVTGSILGGFKFWGSFKTMREAVDWTGNRYPMIGNATVVEVQDPASFGE